MAKTLEEIIPMRTGDKIIITTTHRDYDGVLRKKGTIAHIYLGYTYGCLTDDEEALVYDKKYPFMGTDTKYFKRTEGDTR